MLLHCCISQKFGGCIYAAQASVDMDISMDIHGKSVDMDMDGKFHIHGKPGVKADRQAVGLIYNKN